jgi:hypothetical protein
MVENNQERAQLIMLITQLESTQVEERDAAQK